jgi:hypothetical protein
MPITTVFDPENYQATVQKILKEHLLDTFPTTGYSITFDMPTTESFSKPILWLWLRDGQDLQTEHLLIDGNPSTAILKELTYAVTVITNEPTGRDTAATVTANKFEYDAIFKGKATLGAAGLKRVDCSPFVSVPMQSQQKQWRMAAELSFEVLVERR